MTDKASLVLHQVLTHLGLHEADEPTVQACLYLVQRRGGVNLDYTFALNGWRVWSGELAVDLADLREAQSDLPNEPALELLAPRLPAARASWQRPEDVTLSSAEWRQLIAAVTLLRGTLTSSEVTILVGRKAPAMEPWLGAALDWANEALSGLDLTPFEVVQTSHALTEAQAHDVAVVMGAFQYTVLAARALGFDLVATLMPRVITGSQLTAVVADEPYEDEAEEPEITSLPDLRMVAG